MIPLPAAIIFGLALFALLIVLPLYGLWVLGGWIADKIDQRRARRRDK